MADVIRLYRNNGNMWFNVNSGERDETGKFIYKRINIEEVIPAVPSQMWLKTRSEKSEVVELQRDKFDIVEDVVQYKINPIVTNTGTVLSEGREGEKTVYKLVSKSAE